MFVDTYIYSLHPSVVTTDSGFAVIFWNYYDLQFDSTQLMIYYTKGPSDPPGTIITDSLIVKIPYFPNYLPEKYDFAYGAQRFLYVHNDNDSANLKGIFFSYPDTIINYITIKNAKNPRIIFAFNKFYIFYNTPFEQIYAARVNKDGVLLDPYGIPVIVNSYVKREPDAVLKGNNFFLVFVQNGDIYGAFQIQPLM